MLGLTERLGLEPDNAMPAYRGPGLFRAQGAHAPGQSRPGRQQARRPDGAAAAGPGVRPRPRRGLGLRAADPALAGARRRPLAQRALEDAARPAVPHPGRLAGRLPAAADGAALGQAGRLPARGLAGPLRRPCRAAGTGAAASAAAAAGGASGGAPPAGYRRRRDGPHGAGRRAARRPDLHLHAAVGECRGICRAGRGDRGHRGGTRAAGPSRGLLAAVRRAPERDQGDARPGRDRGQHPAVAQLGGAGRDHRGGLRGGAAGPARHLQVHDRRPPGRHRRRQPCRGRRRHPGGQPVPAPARPPGLAGHLLAEPPEPQLPVLGPVHRPDQPGAAARRGARRPALRAGDRAQADPRSRPSAPARPGWSTGSSATS